MSLLSVVEQHVRVAVARVLDVDAALVDPMVRRSDYGDLQVNGALALAKRLGRDPREAAAAVAELLEQEGLIEASEVSGPGFVNLTVSGNALWQRLAVLAGDPRLGVPADGGGTAVVDYSQPNVAKSMHVGHLRSTVIGDALVRCLEFTGSTVVRRNHVGDWGTQFGMLLELMLEQPERWSLSADESGSQAIARLNVLYRDARARFTTDPAFADRARTRVVALQAGDPATLAAWVDIVGESKIYFQEVYERLGVLLTDADVVGESFYNPYLHDLAEDLRRRGIAVQSDGALCVFFDDICGPDGDPVPLIVRKSDGGFGYAATDLAAIRDRVERLGATRLMYVVDSRQALHFRMVIDTARRAGYLPDHVTAEHVSFGSVLRADGRPFKTRDGDTFRLIELLDEAVDRARVTVRAKNPGLDGDALTERAREVAIGGVKYADLSTSRTRDYLFDLDRMLSLQGNTGVYLQYAHARINSILAKAPAPDGVTDTVEWEPAERALVLKLDGFAEAVAAVVAGSEPHRLCGYLYDLAQTYSAFHENCPVIKAPTAEVRSNRVVLCQVTGATLRLGLGLLGIASPEQL
ncbi:arginine--tRNA ligase [Longispora sp. NPDC051575]|uniref:arginine--tRNA ligase n=1 Tax=Longispora sp. NPDC051575 TaxID=3154943 RepID=UPI0034401A96